MNNKEKPRLKDSCKLYGGKKCMALKKTYCEKEDRCSFFIHIKSDKEVVINVR